MNKYVKYTVVYLYCIYVVCSFLPTKYVFSPSCEILGSEVLFALLNGTSFAPFWQISVFFLISILTGLFATLFFAKKLPTLYINIGINFVFSIFYILTLIVGIASGVGVTVCLVMSSIILIINIFSTLVFKPLKTKKKTIAKPASATTAKTVTAKTVTAKTTTAKTTTAKTTQVRTASNQRSNVANKPVAKRPNTAVKKTGSFGADYCKKCGKILFDGEVCNCNRSTYTRTSNPVKTRKCEKCGRVLFGTEKCSCEIKK